MKNTEMNDLGRAVSLLNFEQENMSKAKSLLTLKYKIPPYNLSLIVHKIFQRLGNYDFNWPPKNYTSLWDQFHHVASEEMKMLNYHP